MSHYKPYPAYRDSGVEWIGQVPEHWQQSKVAWDMKMTIGWTPPTGNRSYYGGPHNWVSIADLSAGRISETKQTLTDDAIAEMRGTQAPAGSLLFSYKLSIGEVALLERPAYTNEAIAAFHPCKRVYMPFWKYAAPVILPRYSRVNIYGSDLLNQELMNSARMAIPDVCEQQDIADSLDRETARIDALITKKTRFIELLKEKRQAIITHAVTQGLDPNATMKDSGVEWIGEVPEHWGITRIKRATLHVVDCLHTTPTYGGNVQFPAVRTADIDRGRLFLDQTRLVSRDVYEERIQRMKPLAGDILYSREGERFGMAALVPEGVDLCLGQRMMMFRIHPTSDSAYIMWVLNSDSVYQQVVERTGGSTSPHVNISDVINFHIPIPPLAEQQQIATHIQKSMEVFDAITAKSQCSIDLLKERRTAFITAAVTGQIDLRESA